MSPPPQPDKATPDQAAAHQFLTELRTRISTQPLPYQHGVEARALESLWEVFAHARTAIKEHPGCEVFAARVTGVLNLVVRPLTGKWHRALEEGRLNGRDGADEFRGELQGVQEQLRAFATELHEMAYGKPREDDVMPPVMTEADLDEALAPLEFGFSLADGGSPANDANSPARAAAIRKSENDAVTARREHHDIKTPAGTNAIGLALSGGGIRSATFSLGAVQVLAEKGFLKEIDFLSTVSGGGYTGSFLTRRLGQGEPLSDVATPHGPDPEPVRYVRQHARFLSGDNLKARWAMATASMAGMVLNWTVPVLAILVLALAATLLGDAFRRAWPIDFYIAAGLSAVATVAYGWGMRRSVRTSQVTGSVLGMLLAVTAFLVGGWVLDLGYLYLVRDLPDRWAGVSGSAGLIALASAALPGVLRFLPVLKEPRVRKLALKGALLLAGLLVPLGGLLLFYLFRGVADGNIDLPVPAWFGRVFGLPEDQYGAAVLVGTGVAFALISLFVININLTGPHRLYRDCLARTFIQKTAVDTTPVKLAGINAGGTAPYHLINTALNVPASVNPALKDRGCDFFLFSREWTGSTAVGYHPTANWRANGNDVDLATAMAVSGAAFSSHMGLGSMPTLRALMALLNARLGFWIKRPGHGGFAAPGFLCLLREMLGLGMSEKAAWLNLSDGGHIENLAVYELLRRRCKFIVCVDGESDPNHTFQGLMTLARHAQIDFGVRLAARLDDLRPDPQTGRTKSHFHLCRIHYPRTEARPAGTGLLLYLKLSVTGNESELIRRYRHNHPEFPHQTTLDQFFDQEQFEAYRQLGVHVAEGLFLPALLNGRQPASVPEWFRQLAGNLLEPIQPGVSP